MSTATLVLGLAAIGIWVLLLRTQPPSGWLHVPLAVGVTLLVRWIAIRENGKP